MLSIEDIYKEMGKNIFVCPLSIDNFRDNSIDLTASKFAWNAKGGNLTDKDEKNINIPPHQTACILTNEAIYVTKRIGGTYHSRVSLAKRGLGHIGTMLDPEYCGQSLIVLHNMTDSDITIGVGDRLVSLVFYYLSTPIHEAVLATPPSHKDKVAKMDSDNRYEKWLNNNQWVNNPKLLKRQFKEKYSEAFNKNRTDYARKSFVKKLFTNKMFIKYSMFFGIVGAAFFAINRWFTPSDNSEWSKYIFPAGTCLIGLIANDTANGKRR
ncbi:MAG: hypothetical protein IKZ82_05785 [Clostridia bacterium]|nr:hypothetical protein [Clostridia bacterium]MBR5948142.1 hypothetical protein [Clostridia bacterium]